MEFQYYGNFDRQSRRQHDQPWWDEEDNLTDRRLNGMSLDEGRQSQRPYRYGMVLLCAGALINWLGLAEDYAEPVRYVGVACIVAGALLICAAMCCWLQSPARQPQNDRASPDTHQIDDPIHVISMPDEETMQQKPPDYDTVAGAPPTYDDAIKLNPARLLPATSSARSFAETPQTPNSDVTIIPGQLDEAHGPAPPSAVVPVHMPHVQTQVPKTPPPPYRPPQAIR
ncbi:extensin-like isoform X1 [Vanessa cardui]|uniref:extensin-like isoform X1 n=1 Tax=Vanessa cardui TaxID=171605 RepID=UPI001F12DE69|nr:extensin-like isoform X1 [Vanessa cardui]